MAGYREERKKDRKRKRLNSARTLFSLVWHLGTEVFGLEKVTH